MLAAVTSLDLLRHPPPANDDPNGLAVYRSRALLTRPNLRGLIGRLDETDRTGLVFASVHVLCAARPAVAQSPAPPRAEDLGPAFAAAFGHGFARTAVVPGRFDRRGPGFGNWIDHHAFRADLAAPGVGAGTRDSAGGSTRWPSTRRRPGRSPRRSS